MSFFHSGFQDELEKLALRPQTKAWAASRAMTSGIAAGLMTGLTIAMAQRGKPKEERRSPLLGAVSGAALGTTIGLGKGMFEKGIEQKVLRALSKGKH